MVLRQAAAMVAKDLRRELRTKEISITTTAFALLLMVIFAFAFYVDENSVESVFPGVLWISIIFSATIAISRTFVQEKDGGCLRALAMIPGTGSSLYLAKFAVNVLVVAAFEVVLVPALIFMFDVDFGAAALAHIAIIAGGSAGFIALGTSIAAMMVHNHMRDVMLPILLYPLATPLLIASVVVTRAVTSGELERAWNIIRIVGAMDVAFFVLSLLLFRWVLGAIE